MYNITPLLTLKLTQDSTNSLPRIIMAQVQSMLLPEELFQI